MGYLRYLFYCCTNMFYKLTKNLLTYPDNLVYFECKRLHIVGVKGDFKMSDITNSIEFNPSTASLGIELGSTNIKMVLIDDNFQEVATSSYQWENKLLDGYWTYSTEDIWDGIQSAYTSLKKEVISKYDTSIKSLGSIGISAMMHGYLPFDKDGHQLVPFRTWRNSNTEAAANVLSDVLKFNIPQRWSIAHLYQATLDKETHVNEISYMTTLAGYVHWMLTGEKVLGVGDASGMFPIDLNTLTYDEKMMKQCEELLLKERLNIKLSNILPTPKTAGSTSGQLTEAGRYLLDTSGELVSGIPMAPPEGDAGTGMVATNSLLPTTGNVSAGTSIFGMIVLEEYLSSYYPEIDMVLTPDGKPVAMIHANNCSSEINSWVDLFGELIAKLNLEVSKQDLYRTLFESSLEAEVDDGCILAYGFHSGENILDMNEGRPMLVRSPGKKFNVANFMSAHIKNCFATLHVGMNILERENVTISKMYAHGGLFKTKNVAQKYLAASIGTNVSVLETAEKGGAWGIAVLAKYAENANKIALPDFLKVNIFEHISDIEYSPTSLEISEYKDYIARFKKGLELEKQAINVIGE